MFFAELDVVDAGACGFGDFGEKTAAAGGLVAGEGGAVGDVVEEQGVSLMESSLYVERVDQIFSTEGTQRRAIGGNALQSQREARGKGVLPARKCLR